MDSKHSWKEISFLKKSSLTESAKVLSSWEYFCFAHLLEHKKLCSWSAIHNLLLTLRTWCQERISVLQLTLYFDILCNRFCVDWPNLLWENLFVWTQQSFPVGDLSSDNEIVFSPIGMQINNKQYNSKLRNESWNAAEYW